MAVMELPCRVDVRRHLGGRTLADVAARLWAKDCQSCVRPLAGHTPALVVVDEIGPLARGLPAPPRLPDLGLARRADGHDPRRRRAELLRRSAAARHRSDPPPDRRPTRPGGTRAGSCPRC